MFLASVEAKVWISHPTVEGRTEPLGLDMSTPRLGWMLQSDASQGTITDMDGKFHVNVKPGQKLKISYVGYKTMTVAAKKGMNVQLESDSQMLQGVEVVAYGTQKKVTITGAISSVKGEELTKTPVSSVSQVLAGAGCLLAI